MYRGMARRYRLRGTPTGTEGVALYTRPKRSSPINMAEPDRVSLGDAHRRAFKRNGVLELPVRLPAELIDPAYDRIAAYIEDSDDHPSLEDRPDQSWHPHIRMHLDLWQEINEFLHPYAAALVGEDLLAEPNDEITVVTRWPVKEGLTDPSAYDDGRLRPASPHVDDQIAHEHYDINTAFSQDSMLFSLGAAIYLHDVPPRSGGFCGWPGAHWAVARHMEEYPEKDVLSGEDPPPAITEDGWDESRSFVDQVPPFEFTGPAGTVVLWHGQMVHSGGLPLEPSRPRMAAFTRFGHREEFLGDDWMPHPFQGDPFPDRYWPAMVDVDGRPELPFDEPPAADQS